MPGIMYSPDPKPGAGGGGEEDETMEVFDEEELVEVDTTEGDHQQMIEEMGDMSVQQNYNANGDQIPADSEENGASDDENMDEENGAAAGPPRDDAEVIFTKHTGSVFAIDLDPVSASLAVTGGEDDKAYVWKTVDGEVLFECEGHKDSVTCALFSNKAKYVATGDLSGVIKVWNVSTKEEVWAFEVTDLEWLEWHSSMYVLFAGTTDGTIWMWKIPSVVENKTFLADQNHSCSVGKLMPDGKRMVAGYADGTVRLWDLAAKGTTSSLLHQFKGGKGEKDAIICMDVHADNTLVLTGSLDGTARLYAMTTGKASKMIVKFDIAPEDKEKENATIEAVGFSPSDLSMIATGTLTGTLSLYDISTHRLLHRIQHESGIVRLRWDVSGAAVLYTCTLDGSCHLWDANTGQHLSEWMGHTDEVLDMDIARGILVTSSDDGTARLFKTPISKTPTK